MTTGFLFLASGGARIAYIPDCKTIPESTMALMRDINVFIIDALRHREHPTHFNVTEALAAACECRAGMTWLTHLSHELSHAALEADLPENVRIATNGLVLEF